jgi:uncharacterized membrane protein YqjE
MSALPDTGPGGASTGFRRETSPYPSPPPNWRVALMDLVTSRLALIQIESKDLARQSIKHVACLVAACICLFFTWALLVVGLIAWVSHATHWPWHWVTLAAGAVHLVSAILLARAAKPAGIDAFPVTRSEFQKDREWIENFHQPKS